MKILLLNPPSPSGEKFTREGRCTQQSAIWTTLWPPVSLVYTGTLLKEHGHEVKVIDCPAEHIDFNSLPRVISAFCPDAVVWSAATPSIDSDLNLASVIKTLNPATYTIVFGTHVTVLDLSVLEHTPSLDIVVRNEPEITILETINALSSSSGLANLSAVEGITYRNRTGTITQNQPRQFIPDIDALPFPDWSLINVNSYRLPLKDKPFLMVMPQRGCHFPCTFCTSSTYYGTRLRTRRVDSIIKEMKEAAERFNIRDFFFWAETFTANPAFVRSLCNAIVDSDLRVSWVCNSRIDTVDGELLYLMRKAGCWMVSYGIESFNPEILKGVRKNIEVSRINKIISLTKEAGILASAHIIFGLPHETLRSALDTKRRVLGLDLDFAQFYCAVPFPGSALYGQALVEGWLAGAASVDFTRFRQERPVMTLNTITQSEVEAVRAQAVREFYLRPRIIFGILRLMNFRHIGKNLISALRFLRPMNKRVK
ncbi:B12-binding domain-containing radical SAM protein [Candidatus Magnetominusculus xianensis]|uniref:Radical SAM domain protein n=1 Tax=Candidatus Magnetominusculus xianensis TaxID=1748249 RepID=A0ABR5SFU2_9BACT|nr:radical SAM protein [Candidatus Magnetominusculus xianensis]KWT86929.1 radical SAM domain protein [Candidatus Magnetominusculus xianensis]MBF0403947.1 radical SAM protein [Nitrospirota bacterium]